MLSGAESAKSIRQRGEGQSPHPEETRHDTGVRGKMRARLEVLRARPQMQYTARAKASRWLTIPAKQPAHSIDAALSPRRPNRCQPLITFRRLSSVLALFEFAQTLP